MRAYEIAAGSSTLDGLRRCERPDPMPQQVLSPSSIVTHVGKVVIRL
jgi:hypothetical protein